MNVKLVNVGYGNMIAANRIIAIINVDSSPAKKIIEDAENAKMLIKVSQGRKARSVIVMDDNHVVVSAVQPETIANRINNNDYLKGLDNVLEQEEKLQ